MRAKSPGRWELTPAACPGQNCEDMSLRSSSWPLTASPVQPERGSRYGLSPRRPPTGHPHCPTMMCPLSPAEEMLSTCFLADV